MADTVHTHPERPAPRLLADHIALDLINTVELVDGAPADRLQSAADVAHWLLATGMVERTPAVLPPGLLDATRRLREVVRAAVQQRKAGKAVDFSALNRLLARGTSHLELHNVAKGGVEVRRRYNHEAADGLLGPVAEAAAELLASGDFSMVRKCESEDCSLWFYDRTRSHRRRWCSMALCGNRHKVAAFRKRNEADQS